LRAAWWNARAGSKQCYYTLRLFLYSVSNSSYGNESKSIWFRFNISRPQHTPID